MASKCIEAFQSIFGQLGLSNGGFLRAQGAGGDLETPPMLLPGPGSPPRPASVTGHRGGQGAL